WKMMKMRTRNAPDRTAKGSVNHQETARLKYIATHRSTYGTRVLTICQIPRPIEGCWNRATIPFQAATSIRGRGTKPGSRVTAVARGGGGDMVRPQTALQAKMLRLIGSRTSVPIRRRMLRTLRR